MPRYPEDGTRMHPHDRCPCIQQNWRPLPKPTESREYDPGLRKRERGRQRGRGRGRGRMIHSQATIDCITTLVRHVHVLVLDFIIFNIIHIVLV